MKSTLAYFVTLVVATTCLDGKTVRAQTLPSLETQVAIQSLHPESRPERNRRGGAGQEPFREFNVERRIAPADLPPGQNNEVSIQGQQSTPLLVENTMVLQFRPDASREQIDKFLVERKLTVLETFPKLGAIKVDADLSRYFSPELTDSNINQTTLRGLVAAINDFKREAIILNATPDIVLRPQADDGTISNLLKASEISKLNVTGDKNVLDWGIENIGADKLWDLPGANDGVVFGILDVGFSRHEDITFLELPPKIVSADHGNHVSAIACGRHTNLQGTHGVLPNCFVRARTGDVFFQSAEGNNILSFMVIFSQILGSLERFLGDYDDIHVYNISMGYNWKSNFGINPDSAESSQWRQLVESQGGFLISALQLADKAGKVIFSAAGNDSTELQTPVSARYASPFNWAVLTAREKGLALNGFVVEAHNSLNKRGPFSNVNGNMSCPGVNILSAVAHDAEGKPSMSSYGRMSGTSMASPYCASALALLSLVRPGYSMKELASCIMSSSIKSDSGVPIPQLPEALATCPARDSPQ